MGGEVSAEKPEGTGEERLREVLRQQTTALDAALMLLGSSTDIPSRFPTLWLQLCNAFDEGAAIIEAKATGKEGGRS
jgi:hypothetical protein